MKVQPPVVVVPGITATTLHDEYPVDPDEVWGMLRKAWDRIYLHPDDTRYERSEPARVRADALFGYPYGDLIEELRHDLTSRADEPTPVFPFPHDWRQPLERIEDRVAAFVTEVVERTSLLRHYHRAGYAAADGRVDLVGHSMGGLIVAGYLARYGGARVRKVATLATPFRGSFEAVLKVATGLSSLPGGEGSREREVARLTPALYHLLPSFEGGVTADDGLGTDLFEADTWQPGVVQTLAEQIRLYGVRGEALDEAARMREARALFQTLLDQAARHRGVVEALRPSAFGMNRNDWLAVVGVGEKTRVRLRIVRSADGAPWFRLRSTDRRNGYPEPEIADDGTVEASREDTGDGTVPYRGARPAFLPQDALVCVTDDDFGYWEIRDRLLEHGAFGKSVTLHSLLPAMNVVQRLVVCHLKGARGRRGASHDGVWGRRAPDLASDAPWRPPIEDLREKGQR